MEVSLFQNHEKCHCDLFNRQNDRIFTVHFRKLPRCKSPGVKVPWLLLMQLLPLTGDYKRYARNGLTVRSINRTARDAIDAWPPATTC